MGYFGTLFFFDDPEDVGNLISGSSAFSKTSLNIRKFTVHILLKPGWKKHELESRLPVEISITSVCRWHHPYGRKWRRTKEPLDESERGEWKSWLKVQKMKIMASGPITSRKTDGETVETVLGFILGGSKITADGDCSHEIQRRLLLGRKVMTNLDSIF